MGLSKFKIGDRVRVYVGGTDGVGPQHRDGTVIAWDWPDVFPENAIRVRYDNGISKLACHKKQCRRLVKRKVKKLTGRCCDNGNFEDRHTCQKQAPVPGDLEKAGTLDFEWDRKVADRINYLLAKAREGEK